MADDSGLNVEALPDELGIRSARFGGEGLNQEQRNELLLSKMEGVSDRRASFHCVLCFYTGPEEIYFFEGVLKGSISHSPLGQKGFGYDPLFIPEGLESTLAQDNVWKDKHSHRSKACQKAMEFFKH